MSPRKKSKPNPKASSNGSTHNTEAFPPLSSSDAPVTAGEGAQFSQQTPQSTTAESNTPAGNDTKSVVSSGQQLNKKPSRKWLGGGGSWRSKAPAVVKTASQSIGVGVAGGAAAEIAEEEPHGKQQAPTKFLTKRKSSKGNTLPASMTKLNVSSDGSIDQTKESQTTAAVSDSEQHTQRVDEPPLPPDPVKPEQKYDAGTFGWRGWWSRPDGYLEGSKPAKADEAQSTPLPGPTPSEEQDKELGSHQEAPAAKDDDKVDNIPATQAENDTQMKDAPPTTVDTVKNNSSSSWFWLWSSAQNAHSSTPTVAPSPAQESAPRAEDTVKPPEGSQNAETSESRTEAPAIEGLAEEPAKEESSPQTKPSAWAFWFRADTKTEDKPKAGEPNKQVGEVAVFDTPSQSHPEAAQFNEQEEPKTQGAKNITQETHEEEPKPEKESLAKRSFRSLRGRKSKPASKDLLTDSASSSKTVSPSKTPPSRSPTRVEALQSSKTVPKQQTKVKSEPPNILLPEFKQTYRLVQQPSFWQQIRQYFLGNETPMPHLHINPAPPRIKKAVAIGIHGFFPAPIVQRVLGQPTGTSIRFATAARQAIEDWTEARGYKPEIEQIALEGEGFIAERVNNLWKLLLNWIEHIKAADFILVACHSQGVPVAIMLVAKLIQFGCVNASRIGVCAMAGINLGPFIEYKTKYLGSIAAELFEFSNPKSLVSQMYLAALDEVLRYGVRILYVGSIDDQLVSLESSTFSTLSHPYIYRAVFVDGRIHAPDFLTHLVGFALKLRNLGLPDHGLVRELSPALAGSLYGGEGHSRIYDESSVYDLAIQHALETTSLPVPSVQQRPSTSASFQGISIPVPGAKVDEKDVYALRVKDYESVGSGNQNPFFLPWAMRGLLEEEFVKRELGDEVEELLGMFEEWRPQNKQLKDVKFRLEGVRSKL